MRYFVPMILAGLMLTGCASHQCRHEAAPEPEPAPTTTEGESVPFLEDIPILGFMFKKTEPKPASAAIPLLGDIPILGELFKRGDEPEKNIQPEDE